MHHVNFYMVMIFSILLKVIFMFFIIILILGGIVIIIVVVTVIVHLLLVHLHTFMLLFNNVALSKLRIILHDQIGNPRLNIILEVYANFTFSNHFQLFQ